MQALSPIENVKKDFENYLKQEPYVLTLNDCEVLERYGTGDGADLLTDGTIGSMVRFYIGMVEYVKKFHNNRGKDYWGNNNVALYFYEYLLRRWMPLQEGAGHGGGVVALEFANEVYGQQGSWINREIIMDPGTINAFIIELAAYAVLENRPIILAHLRHKIEDRNRSIFTFIRRHLLDPLCIRIHFNWVSVEGSFEYLLAAKVDELRPNESKPPAPPQMSQLQQQYIPQALTPNAQNTQLSPPTDPDNLDYHI